MELHQLREVGTACLISQRAKTPILWTLWGRCLCQAAVNAMSQWGSRGCGEQYGKSDLTRVCAEELALTF